MKQTRTLMKLSLSGELFSRRPPCVTGADAVVNAREDRPKPNG